MVCREIRRNSAGCLRMRDECEKCREILSVGEPGRAGDRERCRGRAGGMHVGEEMRGGACSGAAGEP